MTGKNLTNAYLALIFVCIVWGTTYLAIRVGVLHYPAFLFAGTRQVAAGLIILLAGWLMIRRTGRSETTLRQQRTNLWQQAKIGFLLITMGNGVVTWGEKFVPSGIAALICAMMPLFTVLINLMASREEKLNPTIALGLLTGLAGVGLIFRDNLADLADSDYLMGISAIFLATFCWAAGSVLSRKQPAAVNPVFNSGIQLLSGGIFLLVASPFLDSYREVVWWQPEAFWSLVYLIVFGSVLAYTAYMYILKKLPVGLATSYAYVNPLVAVLLGYWILEEPLTTWTGLAFVLIIGSILIVKHGYRIQRREKESGKGIAGEIQG